MERYKTGEGNGDPNCPFNYLSKDVPALKLGNWLVHQRSAKRGRKGHKISVERIRRLEELGVWWKNRIKYLTEDNRRRDARALFLEFKNDDRILRT